MKTPAWSKESKVVTVTCSFVVALAVTLISGAPAKAQGTRPAPGPGSLNTQPQAAPEKSGTDPKPVMLWGTVFDTFKAGAEATCHGSYCSASVQVFAEKVVCPVPSGQSCTFQITIEAQNWVSSNDFEYFGEDGVYYFTVDGATPSPGPVDPRCNCYTWSEFAIGSPFIGTSYAVTAIVTNTTNQQKHSIDVGIGCYEVYDDSNGCSATIPNFANLQVAVYTPSGFHSF
jgi:hypothetical protein